MMIIIFRMHNFFYAKNVQQDFSFTNMVFKKKNLFWSFAKKESLSSDLHNTCKFKLPDHINFNGHTSF